MWLFTSEGALGAPATAVAGQQVNTVTVSATDDTGARYSDDDRAYYFGTSAGIVIVKAINAVDPNNPTAQEDANDPDHPVILTAGTVPTFTYQVRNSGTDALKDIRIVDDAGTDAVADDFAPVAVTVGFKGQSYNVGDADHDGLLDVGETWLYTSAGVYTTVLGQGAYTNIAKVTGTDIVSGTAVRDDDPANFVVAAAPHAMGRMTGGGSVYTDDGTRVTHGFELHCDTDVGPNNLEVNWDQNNFHLEQVTAMSCYDDPRLNPLPRPAPFDTLVGEGIGLFNNKPGYHVSFMFTDAGEPGTSDFARIEIRDPQGNLVLFVAGNLHNGNQQAHPENKDVALLQAATAPEVTAGDLQTLKIRQLFQSLAEAKREWAQTGLNAAQLATLDALRVEVADLPGLTLGQLQDGVITIDANAAGWGWFIDPTPSADEEFALALSQDQRAATPDSPGFRRIDLLTVVEHEIGHLIGYEHGTLDVMNESLAAGVRITPQAVATSQPSGAGAPVGQELLVINGPSAPVAFMPNAELAHALAGTPVQPGMAPMASLVLGGVAALKPASGAVHSGDLEGGGVVGVGLGGSFVSLAAGRRPAAVASSEEPGAQQHTSRPSEEDGVAPTINWDNRIDLAANLAPSPAAGSPAWLDDFLNHLGQTEAQQNPNAGMRVRPAPVTAGHA